MFIANDIEIQLVRLDIENEKNEELIMDEGVEEEVNMSELCLVGNGEKYQYTSYEDEVSWFMKACYGD